MKREREVEAFLTFQDVAACFSEEESKLLHQWQKEVYKNVMKDIQQVLLSLGPLISASIFSIRAKEKGDLCCEGYQDSEARPWNEHNTRYPNFSVDNLVKAGQETASNFVENQFVEEVEKDTGHVAVDSVVSLIFKEENSGICYNQNPHFQNRENILTGLSVLETDDFLKKEDESQSSSLVYYDDEVAEHTSSPSSGCKDNSLYFKEELVSYNLNHHNLMKKEGIIYPTAGLQTTERKIKERSHITINKKQTDCNTISEKPNENEHQRYENTAYARSQISSEKKKNLDYKNKTTTEHGFQTVERKIKERSHIIIGKKQTNYNATPERSNENEHQSYENAAYARSSISLEKRNLNYESKIPTQYGHGDLEHFNLHACAPILEQCEQYKDCERNLKIAEALTLQPNLEKMKKCGPFPCNQCEKMFGLKRNLTAHLKLHTGERPHQCIECNKSFSLKNTLVRHIRRHTDERPYECPKCEKRFRTKSTLNAHLTIHSGKKPYQCTECDKSFRQKSHLTGHKAKHTGKMPYHCTKCDKHFCFKCSLVRHQRAHHY